MGVLLPLRTAKSEQPRHKENVDEKFLQHTEKTEKPRIKSGETSPETK